MRTPSYVQHLELLDVVDGLAGHHRVHAARVVADHAAEGAAACVAGSGAEREAVLLGGVAQVVEHDARLDARAPAPSGSSSTMRFRYFDMSRTTATLQHWPARLVPAPRGRMGAPASRQARMVATTSSQRPRDHHADRHLPVVRGVGRVERARAVVEAHLAAHRLLQRALEAVGAREPGARMRVRAREGSKHLRFHVLGAGF